jgi:hypothetical protein
VVGCEEGYEWVVEVVQGGVGMVVRGDSLEVLMAGIVEGVVAMQGVREVEAMRRDAVLVARDVALFLVVKSRLRLRLAEEGGVWELEMVREGERVYGGSGVVLGEVIKAFMCWGVEEGGVSF